MCITEPEIVSNRMFILQSVFYLFHYLPCDTLQSTILAVIKMCVCLSKSGNVSKQRNISLRGQGHWVSKSILVSGIPELRQNSNRIALIWGHQINVVTKLGAFWPSESFDMTTQALTGGLKSNPDLSVLMGCCLLHAGGIMWPPGEGEREERHLMVLPTFKYLQWSTDNCAELQIMMTIDRI